MVLTSRDVKKNVKKTKKNKFKKKQERKEPFFFLHLYLFYTEMIPVKQAKLNDVKSLFKYLRQDSISFISNIPGTTMADIDSDDD